jgi:hypothetical protein
MGPGIGTTVLATHSSRSRVVRERDGAVHLFWGVLGVRMSQGGFCDLAGLVAGAEKCLVRCGELARNAGGRVVRCSMGQVMLRRGDLTVWFTPEEFEEFCRLVGQARQRLADSAPAPPLGLSWRPEGEFFVPN